MRSTLRLGAAITGNLRCFALSLRNIFNFRHPEIIGLEYVDLIVKQKGYFFISWQVACAYLVHISADNSFHFSKEGMYVIKLNDNIQEISLCIRNLWRKNKRIIKLQRIDFNAQTEFNAQLISLVTETKNLPEVTCTFPQMPVAVNPVNITLKQKTVTIKNIDSAYTILPSFI